MKNTSSRLITFILFCSLFCISHHVFGKVELPPLLANNMVLQQNTNVKLWGKSKINTLVNINPSWTKETYSIKSDKNGNWIISIPTPVAGGPYEIRFSDGEELILHDILIGEVWFCSGQSNMEMPIKGFPGQPVDGGNDVIANAKAKQAIRMFTGARLHSATRLDNVQGTWSKNTPENVANVSATAYFFAQYIQNILEVPVGIIISSWGGSKIEAWLNEETLRSGYEFDLSHLNGDSKPKTMTHHTPAYLFNAMVAPFTDYSIKGFLWYQGESNLEDPALYKKMMQSLVSSWRKEWGEDNLPFYYTQIAPYSYNESGGTRSVAIREAQLECMDLIANSGMAVTLDAGNEKIIHPSKKKEVGTRLAYWALAKTYGIGGFGYTAPTYDTMEVEDNKIRLKFKYHSSRCVTPIGTNLANFEIAGNDKKFYPAKAHVDGGAIVVSSPEVKEPVAVRYAYKNYVEASVFDDMGLPLSSFRTDRW